MEKYYDLAETAEILGVSVRTLRDWQRKDKLKVQRYYGGNKWYVSQKEIERLQANMIDNSSEK